MHFLAQEKLHGVPLIEKVLPWQLEHVGLERDGLQAVEVVHDQVVEGVGFGRIVEAAFRKVQQVPLEPRGSNAVEPCPEEPVQREGFVHELFRRGVEQQLLEVLGP